MDKLITNELSLGLDQRLRNDLIENFKKIEQGINGQYDLFEKQILTMLGDVPLINQNEVTMARIDRNSKEFSTLKGRLDSDQQAGEAAYEEVAEISDEVKGSRVSLNGRSYSTLKDRLDGEAKDLNNNINQQLAQMNTAPESVTNIAELKAKYPNGKVGIFVAVDNGHKYVWLNGAWKDTGVYQSVTIADQSVTNDMLRDDTKTGFLLAGESVKLNTAQRTLTVNKAYHVVSGTRQYNMNQSNYSFNMSADLTGFYLYYDTATQDINLLSSGIPTTAIFLGWINLTNRPTYQLMVSNVISDIDNPNMKPVDHNPYISTGNTQINIDTMNKTMVVDVPYFYAFYPNQRVNIAQRGTINLDNGSSASFIFYDTSLEEIVTTDTTSGTLPITYIYLGAIDWAYPFNSRLLFPATIDGIDIFNQRQADKRVELASKYPLILDVANKTLNIDKSGWVTVQYDDLGLNIQNYNDGDIDISGDGASASYLFVNVNTLEISAYSSRKYAPWGSLYLGWYEWNSNVYNLNFRLTLKENDLESDYAYGSKSVTFFGDSITKADGNDNPWTKLTAHALGTTATVNGVNGTTYTTNSTRPDSAVERVDQIKNQYLVVIWFGVNDFHYGRPLGKFGDTDTSTVYGAADKVYNSLIDNNPTAQIMVMTPMKNHGYNAAPDSFTKNSAGLYQLDYVNAIKQVADKYSLPVLDMYTESGISAMNENHNQLYLKDGLHPNQAGSYRVAKRVIGFIKSHL